MNKGKSYVVIFEHDVKYWIFATSNISNVSTPSGFAFIFLKTENAKIEDDSCFDSGPEANAKSALNKCVKKLEDLNGGKKATIKELPDISKEVDTFLKKF